MLNAAVTELRSEITALKNENCRLREELNKYHKAPAASQGTVNTAESILKINDAQISYKKHNVNKPKNVTAQSTVTPTAYTSINEARVVSAERQPNNRRNAQQPSQQHQAQVQPLTNESANLVSSEVSGENSTNNEEKWNEVVRRNRKNRPQIIRGTSSDGCENLDFAPRRCWLYVGGAKQGTTKENITTFLARKFPGREFLVDYIQREEISSVAFKIGADYDLMERLYNPITWPVGAIVRRYNFRPNKARYADF